MRFQPYGLTLLLLGSAFAGLSAQMPGGQMPMGQTAQPSAQAQAAGPLRITYGAKSAEWTVEKLAALPHISVTVYNEHAKAKQTYSGVRLNDLLTPLGVPAQPGNKELLISVVGEGSDGYRVLYSLGEVSPSVSGIPVIVADAMDGQPLKQNGPFQLVTSGDVRPARWIRNLVAIHVTAPE